MAGEEIASGYLSIGPALAKDFKAKLDAQLAPVAAEVGTSMGKATAAAMPAGVAASSTAVRAAGQNAGRTLVDGIATTVQATAGPRITTAIGGTRSALTGLKQDLTSLAGKTTSLSVVRNAASGLVGSLGGVASLIGYGGPLGVALAAGGLALGAYAQNQADAQAAVDQFTAALDKQSGRVTADNVTLAVQGIAKTLGPDKIATLKGLGVTLSDVTVAFLTGGKAQSDYVAKLEALQAKGTTVAKGLHGVTAPIYNEQAAAVHALIGAVGDQNSVLSQSARDWATNKTVIDAAATATSRLGLTVDKTARALDTTAGASQIAASSFTSISNAAGEVAARIKAVPKDVTITARSSGIDALIGKVNGAIAAYVALVAAASAANSIVTDGERHGADLGATSTANRVASQAGAAADAAVAAARSAVASHNAAAKAKQSQEAATRASKAATAAAKAQAAAQAAAQRIADQRAALSNSVRGVVTGSRNGVFPDVTSIPHTGPGLSRFLAKQLDTLKRFRVNLATLAKRGLPQVFLEQLIAAGLDGAQTAAALVTANDVDFRSIKSLTTQLQTQANALAGQEVGMLYGTGVNAARSLIAGVTSEQRAVEAAATNLAKGLDAAFRKALGIHSPSRVFFAHGLNTARGAELGMTAGQAGVNRAALALVRPPSAVGVQSGALGAAAAGGPFIGELTINNPTPEPATSSVTQGLRKAAFLTGRTA